MGDGTWITMVATQHTAAIIAARISFFHILLSHFLPFPRTELSPSAYLHFYFNVADVPYFIV